MGYTPSEFTTAAVINANTLFQNYDDEIQQLMADSGTYLEAEMAKVYTETGNIVTSGIGINRVENIASLKLQDGLVFNTIEVLGYYTKGDDGGGTFYWDSSSTETDNGGTIIQATGITTGRWKRIFSGAVNVKWFGAKGDDITDDTISIQKAIDSSTNVFIPDNYTFIVSGLIMKSDSTLFGVNGAWDYGSKLKLKANSTLPLIKLYGGRRGMTIKDLQLDGNRNNQSSTVNIIEIDNGGTNTYIQKCYIKNANGYAVDINHSDVWWIEDCYLLNSALDVIRVQNSSDFIISNNQISSYNGTYSGGAGIRIYNCSSYIVSSNIVFLCDKGMLLNISNLGNIYGNRFNDMRQHLMYFSGNNQGNNVVGNEFIAGGLAGVVAGVSLVSNPGERAIIDGNNISNNVFHGTYTMLVEVYSNNVVDTIKYNTTNNNTSTSNTPLAIKTYLSGAGTFYMNNSKITGKLTNVDFNSLYESGNYYCDVGASGATYNAPGNYQWHLEVKRYDRSVIQTARYYHNSSTLIYTRTRFDTTWSAWRSF